jgi:pectin methylesterase-like acyl-CoA thioesterase
MAQVVYRDTTLGSHIKSAPWTDMSGFSWKDARFFEYHNTGSGAGVNSNRPQLTDAQAPTFTPQRYLTGSDGWNPIS